jgi:hypothetical protein
MARKLKPKPIQFLVSPEVHSRLEEMASRKGVTMAQLLRNALHVYERLQRYEQDGRRVLLVPRDDQEATQSVELWLP